MKKVICILSILAVSFCAFSQETENFIQNQEVASEQTLASTVTENSNEPEATETLEKTIGIGKVVENESENESGNYLENEPQLQEPFQSENAEESAELSENQLQKDSENTESQMLTDLIEDSVETVTGDSDNSVEADKESSETPVKTYEEEKSAIKSYIELNKEKLLVEIKADEIIAEIEAKKAVIDNRRKNISAQEADYFTKVDEEAKKTADEIINAPLETIETDTFGTQTKDSIARRKANAQKVLEEAEVNKTNRSRELWDSIKAEENADISELNKLYSTLESTKYVATSLNEEVTLTVGEFDGKNGKWKAVISSKLLEKDNLINEEFDLTYSQVTGKKYLPVDKMKEEQFEDYTDNVNKYDEFFRSKTDALYAKVTYKIIRWQNASEYRLMANDIEIVRLDGNSEKVIYKISHISPKIFVQIPMIEIRSEKQIKKEKEKTVNRLEREQKAKEKRLGVKLYSDPDVAAKAYNKDPVIQKGRGTVLINVMDLEDFSNPQIGIDRLQLDATVGLGKFGFIGGDFGVKFPIHKNDLSFNGGITGGMNVKIGHILRPYLLLGADYSSGYTVSAKAGAGCDFILAKVINISAGYNFNYNFGLSEFIDKDLMVSIIANGNAPQVHQSYNHQISVGIGFAW